MGLIKNFVSGGLKKADEKSESNILRDFVSGGASRIDEKSESNILKDFVSGGLKKADEKSGNNIIRNIMSGGASRIDEKSEGNILRDFVSGGLKKADEKSGNNIIRNIMSGGASSNNKIVESIKNNSRMTEKFREILKQRLFEDRGKIDKEPKSRNFLEILREKITDIKSKRESISLLDSIKNTSETVDLCCKSHNTPGCLHGSQNSKHEALLQSVHDEILNLKNTSIPAVVAPIHDMEICD